MKTFTIVWSNYTARLFAWVGSPEANKKFLGNRSIEGAVEAADAEQALSLWRARQAPQAGVLRTLNISPCIQHEWQVRCIGDVIAGLAHYGGGRCVAVDAATALEIVADCQFQADPQAIDHAPSTRRAYSALGQQAGHLFRDSPATA